MPRLLDYPRASFRNGQEIAAAVEYLGGNCSIQSCADKMGKKVSGAFKGLISSAVKHGLVTLKKEILTVSDLYKSIKLSYSDEEKIENLRKSFLLPPLYYKIYERFKGKDLPVSMLDKLLVREFEVEEVYVGRIVGYFIEGSKSVKLLENGKLIDSIKVTIPTLTDENNQTLDEEFSNTVKNHNRNQPPFIEESAAVSLQHDSYSVSIIGPGMNTKIVINEEDDLLILEAMLNKVKKKLKEGSK